MFPMVFIPPVTPDLNRRSYIPEPSSRIRRPVPQPNNTFQLVLTTKGPSPTNPTPARALQATNLFGVYSTCGLLFAALSGFESIIGFRMSAMVGMPGNWGILPERISIIAEDTVGPIFGKLTEFSPGQNPLRDDTG